MFCIIGKKRKKEKKRTAYYRVKITIKNNITIDSFKIRLILKFLLKEESLKN